MKNTTAYLLLTCFVILSGCYSTENKISQQNQVKDSFTESSPSRNAEYVLPRLAKFTHQQKLTNIQDILGEPDGDCGSAIHDLWYTLDDNSSVRVRATYQGVILSIERQGDSINGYVETIYTLKKTEKKHQ